MATTSDTAYHGKKSNIMKRLPPFPLPYLPNKESNAAIIIEITPVIRAKCASVTSYVDCFSDLAVWSSINFRVWLLVLTELISFLIYILNKAWRKTWGMGSRFVFTGNTKPPNKMAEDFLMNSVNKNDFNEFLAKAFYHPYRGDQIYILFHRDSVLTIIMNKTQSTGDTSFITLCWPTNL